MGVCFVMVIWFLDVRRWMLYVFGIVYVFSIFLVIGIGFIVSRLMLLEVIISKIVNGVFDVISGGIFLYIGFVELLVYEFMFNFEMCKVGL